MKLETMFEEWGKDSQIDKTKLDDELLNIPKLHHKYFSIYTAEKLILRKYDAELKQLKLEKYEFYTQGPTKEQLDLGWRLPPQGKILKTDANNYVEADKDIIELTLKIGLAHEKIELLESIIKSLVNRGFQIKSSIDWMKFQGGANW